MEKRISVDQQWDACLEQTAGRLHEHGVLSEGDQKEYGKTVLMTLGCSRVKVVRSKKRSAVPVYSTTSPGGKRFRAPPDFLSFQEKSPGSGGFV